MLQNKILGIYLSSDLRWEKHVDYITTKAASRIWMIRRLLELGLDNETVLDCYFKEIRSILEYGSVIFDGSLTKRQSKCIKNVQRNILRLLARNVGIQMSYDELTIYFSAEPLWSRRIEAFKTFVKRSFKKPRFQLFKKKPKSYNTRDKKHTYFEYQARTTRFQSSPLVRLTKLANELAC